MTTLTSNTMTNKVKKSYSNSANALYTIAVLMWTKLCHKATLCLHVGNMLPVSSIKQCFAVKALQYIPNQSSTEHTHVPCVC